jgi:enamine deaminase RidA (YjgF/YER057c/UK114 family)
MPVTLREIGSERARAAPTHAQAVEVTGASRLLYVSGQIPVSAESRVPEGFADQARLVWAKLFAQLEAAWMELENLVKVTVFLSDRRPIADYRATRDAMLGGRRIGVTCIVCNSFDPAWLLEIEAVAAA